MGTNRPLTCQECGAIVLPALHGLKKVRCQYCGEVVKRYGSDGRDVAPERPVRSALAGRSGRIVAAVAAVAVLGTIGAIVGVVVGGGEEASAPRPTWEEEASAPRPAWEEGAPAEAVDPDIREALPETPDPAEVARRLEAIDVSHCPGDFAVSFGIEIIADGTATITSVDWLENRNGGRLSCLSAAIEELRFPPSRSGLATTHELRSVR